MPYNHDWLIFINIVYILIRMCYSLMFFNQLNPKIWVQKIYQTHFYFSWWWDPYCSWLWLAPKWRNISRKDVFQSRRNTSGKYCILHKTAKKVAKLANNVKNTRLWKKCIEKQGIADRTCLLFVAVVGS